MQPLAQYALIGSVLAGIAGAVILALVTLQHGFQSRRARADGDDESTELSSQRPRTVRVADTLAVLCFAVAASLGVVGLTQQSRVGATSADGAFTERLERLETRLAGTESELHARSSPAPDFKSWEERLARLESRLGAAEERATVADRRLGDAEARVAAADRRVGAAENRAAAADRRAQAAERLAREHGRDSLMLSPTLAPTPPKPSVPTPAAVKPAPVGPTLAPSGSAPVAPERPDANVRPEAMPAPSPPAIPAPPRASLTPPAKPDAPKVDAPKPDSPSPPPTTQAVPSPRREPARSPRTSAAKASEPTFGEKLRQDWDAIKRDVSRSGEDWREGWEKVRRLFAR